MNESLTVYEKAPTTNRSAETIAQLHGFESVAQLAESLPEAARVIDVGAGASPFGDEVAKLRPDASVIKFDYSYNDPAILEEVCQNAPANVQHIAGDVTKLRELLAASGEQERFDFVGSYWLLPHLSIDTQEPAQKAAMELFAITKPGGLLSVGPVNKSNASLPRYIPRIPFTADKPVEPGTMQVIKDGTMDATTFAQKVVRETKLPPFARLRQKAANEVATPFFGTSRWAVPNERGIPQLYDKRKGEHVSPVSRRGLQLTGGFALAAGRYIAEHNQDIVPTARKVAFGVGAIASAIIVKKKISKRSHKG